MKPQSPIEKLASCASSPQPEEQVDHLLTRQFDGKTYRLYPITEREDIKRAAQHLHENRGQLPFLWRREIAAGLLKEADRRDVHLSTAERRYVEKAAGMGCGSPEEVSRHVLLRAPFAGDPEIKDRIIQLAAVVKEAEFDHENHMGCAETLGVIDELLGLNNDYADGFPTPEESVFAKSASEMHSLLRSITALANGDVVYESQLEQANLPKIASVIGEEFEQKVRIGPLVSIERFKEAAEELPPDDAETLSALLPGGEEPFDWSFLVVPE